MEERRRTPDSPIDIYSIVKDICANWYFIIALAISAALFTYTWKHDEYQSTYTVEAIYAVSAKGVNNSVYENLTSTQDTAAKLTQIINSSVMQKKVCEDLDISSIPGKISCEVVQKTNLLSLKVRATTPAMAYKVLVSVMENYPDISQYLLGDVVMEVLMEPVIPDGPDQTLNVRSTVIKVFLLMAAVATAFVVFMSYLKDTIRNRGDVNRKLDTRLLGTICHEEKNKTLMSKIRKKKQPLLISNPVLSFRYVEMVQKAGCKIQSRMEDIQAQTLLVTSCLENEGKSTVAANLALSLTRIEKKVVLVDLDFRKPSQYKIFEQSEADGKAFAQVLQGRREMSEDVITDIGDGLSLVYNVRKYNRSTEIISSGQLENVLEFLKERFDYVIIDTPPMAFVADTEEIAHRVDASVIVVRERVAAAKTINDMLDVLEDSESKLLGCIFNDAHNRIGSTVLEKSGYGYGYGHYYRKESRSHE